VPNYADRGFYHAFPSNSAFEVGYPAAYVCDETIQDATPYIHSSRDTYDTLEFDHILEHTRVRPSRHAYLFAFEPVSIGRLTDLFADIVHGWLFGGGLLLLDPLKEK